MRDHIDKSEKPSLYRVKVFCFLQKCKVVVRQIDSCIRAFWINYGCKVKGKHILGKLSFRHSICEKGRRAWRNVGRPFLLATSNTVMLDGKMDFCTCLIVKMIILLLNLQ